MSHMQQHVMWKNFFATQVVEREEAEAEAVDAYETAQAEAYLGAADAKSVTEGKKTAASNVTVQQKKADARTAKYARKAMEVARDNREACAGMLSRELTRRTSSDPYQRRVDRNTA